jgi:drug/metabolite transporter (DMT)-like permease
MRLLLLVSLVWSFSFGLIGNRLAGVPPPLVALVRLTLSLLVFLPFARRVPWRTGLRLAGIGGVQFGLMYLAYIASFGFLKSHEVALFTVFTPIYVALLNDAGQRRFAPANLAAAGLAVAGAGIVSWQGLTSSAPLIGFALVQASNVCFAFGQVAYRSVMSHLPDQSEEHSFAWLYLGAVAVVLPAGLHRVTAHLPAITPAQWGILVYLGLVASGICFFLWNLGARRTGSGMLAVLNNAKIPLAVAVSLLVFGEHTAPVRLILGGSLIGLAALLTRTAGAAKIGDREASQP